jgi:hypothetical protein
MGGTDILVCSCTDKNVGATGTTVPPTKPLGIPDA